MGKRKKGNRNEESDEKEAEEESDPQMRGRDPDLAEGSGSLL